MQVGETEGAPKSVTGILGGGVMKQPHGSFVALAVQHKPGNQEPTCSGVIPTVLW